MKNPTKKLQPNYLVMFGIGCNKAGGGRGIKNKKRLLPTQSLETLQCHVR